MSRLEYPTSFSRGPNDISPERYARIFFAGRPTQQFDTSSAYSKYPREEDNDDSVRHRQEEEKDLAQHHERNGEEEDDDRRKEEELQYIKMNIQTKPIIFKEESISIQRINEIIDHFTTVLPSAPTGGRVINMTQDEYRGTPEYYSVGSCKDEKDRIHQLLLKDPNNQLLKSWKF